MFVYFNQLYCCMFADLSMVLSDFASNIVYVNQLYLEIAHNFVYFNQLYCCIFADLSMILNDFASTIVYFNQIYFVIAQNFVV